VKKKENIIHQEKINREKTTKEIKTEGHKANTAPAPDTSPIWPVRAGILGNNFMNGIVRPDVPGAFEEIFIARENLHGAPFGMKVICEVIDAPKDYEERGRQYYRDEFSGQGMAKGRIREVLGEPGSYDAAMQGILITHGLKTDFPGTVIAQTKKLPSEISSADINREILSGRIDRRDEMIITVDGEDAKDLDDAISIKQLEGGNVLLGVHIADVTHYVTEAGAIDREASARGTSVYLADRVIPMLPQVLSNGLCSLHPGSPKLALSVMMEFSKDGDMISSEFTESVIQSNCRFTYDEVFRMFGEEQEKIEQLEKFRPMLHLMIQTTRILREKRSERGAISFEFPETKVLLDKEKKVLDVYAAPVTFANEMIEECMIACNEAVAMKFALLKAPFIYRVHEKPDEEKMERFIKTARLLGEKTHFSPSPKSEEIHKAILQMEDKPYRKMLMQLLLRSMAKARYSNQCLGHFGLASTYYCHFTSPIRRYPDLFIHRVVKSLIHEESFPSRWVKSSALFSDLSSDAERNAMQAERESIDFKTAEYMEGHIGEIYEGQVTGMFHGGVFVQLPNTIEGLAPFRTMGAYYEYDEEQMTARSDVGNRVVRIGDTVTVKVTQADRVARRIEFTLDESSLVQEKGPARNRKSAQNSKFSKGKSGGPYKGGNQGKGSNSGKGGPSGKKRNDKARKSSGRKKGR
jgi:ribonuclease R